MFAFEQKKQVKSLVESPIVEGANISFWKHNGQVDERLNIHARGTLDEVIGEVSKIFPVLKHGAINSNVVGEEGKDLREVTNTILHTESGLIEVYARKYLGEVVANVG